MGIYQGKKRMSGGGGKTPYQIAVENGYEGTMECVCKQNVRQPKCVSIESFVSFLEFLRVIFCF